MSTGTPEIRFNRRFEFTYGLIESVAPLVRRLVARNPGPYTFYGTGTYIIGRGEVAVIDPGPDLPEHVDALLSGLGDERITHILITHTHRDHSPAARVLQKRTGAAIYAYGPHDTAPASTVVEEGADRAFIPDVRVRTGDRLDGESWSFQCVHTPGHTSNHMCYQLRDHRALFCGDHVMAWNTTVIAPPDGDMSDYLASLELLLRRNDRTMWPTHGPVIDDPKPFVRSYIEHRQTRVQQIVAVMASGESRIPNMVEKIYRDLPVHMRPAAERSVLATLIYLVRQGRVIPDGTPELESCFELGPANG